MPTTDLPPGAPLEQTPKRPQEPLVMRMYYKQHLVDLVRLFGYSEMPMDEAREKLKPLVEKYGQTIMADAAEEIIFIDNAKMPAVARLTDHARKLAVGILGSPRKTTPVPTPPEPRVTETPPAQSPSSAPRKPRRTPKQKRSTEVHPAPTLGPDRAAP